jgi:hypothetical protein
MEQREREREREGCENYTQIVKGKLEEITSKEKHKNNLGKIGSNGGTENAIK